MLEYSLSLSVAKALLNKPIVINYNNDNMYNVFLGAFIP